MKIFRNFFEIFLKFYIIPWEDSNAWIANIFWTGPSHIRPKTYIVSSAFCLWNNEKLLKNNQNLNWKMTNPPLKMIWCDLEIWILFRRLFVIFIFDIWHFIFFYEAQRFSFGQNIEMQANVIILRYFILQIKTRRISSSCVDLELNLIQ